MAFPALSSELSMPVFYSHFHWFKISWYFLSSARKYLKLMCDGNIFINLIQALAPNFPQELYSTLAP